MSGVEMVIVALLISTIAISFLCVAMAYVNAPLVEVESPEFTSHADEAIALGNDVRRMPVTEAAAAVLAPRVVAAAEEITRRAAL